MKVRLLFFPNEVLSFDMDSGAVTDGKLTAVDRPEDDVGRKRPTETYLIPRSYFVNKQPPVAVN